LNTVEFAYDYAMSRVIRSTSSRWIGATLCVLLALGCRESNMEISPMPDDGQELTILNVIAGTHSHETRAMQIVIRDMATLAQVPLVDVPVNFANEMLLVVTLGRLNSDQFSVSIDRVVREGNVLRVTTTVRQPPPGVPMVMASPYCIAVVPRCDLNVAGFSAVPPTRVRSWQQSPPPEGF
jgi:hypothetical protein